MMKGLIFDIEKYAIHDGPGIRTLIFFKGCPLNCIWCQNPESINPKPELSYIKSKCIKCGICYEICPEHAIKKDFRKILKQKCKVESGCKACADQCPSNALEIAGREVSVDELLEIILEDKEYYKTSNGGITCSGGEPTYQWSFVKQFLIACKKENISTAIETCGFFNPNIINDVFRYSDTILFDLKHLDDKNHVKLTGRSNELILKNLNKLIQLCNDSNNKKLIIRLPLVPYNDSEEHLKRIERYLMDLGIDNLVLLPYHSLYLQKIDNFNLKRKKLKDSSYNPKSIEKISNYFKNIKIIIGG